MRRWLFLLEPMLFGALLGLAAFSTVFLALDDYNFTWTWQARGMILGAFAGVGGELLLRQEEPLPRRFSLRTLLLVVTVAAIILGVLLTLD